MRFHIIMEESDNSDVALLLYWFPNYHNIVIDEIILEEAEIRLNGEKTHNISGVLIEEIEKI